LRHVRRRDRDGEFPVQIAARFGKIALEHDAIRRNRLIAESCSRFKKLERVLTAKPDPRLRNALWNNWEDRHDGGF
jgi:hypothetical protein